VREIRTLRVMWRDLGTELWDGLRHQCLAKAAGNSYSPDLQPPHQIPTLPGLSESPTGRPLPPSRRAAYHGRGF